MERTASAEENIEGRRADTFEKLFERERRPMVRLAYLITSSAEEAEELVHDAFVEVYKRWSRLDRPGAYLRTCVVNRSIRHKRRDQERVVLLGAREVTVEHGYDHTLAALAELAPRARAMVVLRYYADMSQSEIAETLGIPVGTVKSGLHNALVVLKEVLS
jgi:RNA polymerase sigma factor (sigma-70 family)